MFCIRRIEVSVYVVAYDCKMLLSVIRNSDVQLLKSRGECLIAARLYLICYLFCPEDMQYNFKIRFYKT